MYVYLPLDPQSLMADDLRYKRETQPDKIEVPHGNLQLFDKKLPLTGSVYLRKIYQGRDFKLFESNFEDKKANGNPACKPKSHLRNRRPGRHHHFVNL